MYLPRRCNTNETQYRAAAQNLISLGLRDLGYQYVNLYAQLTFFHCKSDNLHQSPAAIAGGKGKHAMRQAALPGIPPQFRREFLR